MGWLNTSKQIPILSPQEGYNRWASSYKTEKNPIKSLSDEVIGKFLPALNNKVVLDAGCGTGKFCELAEKQNASKVYGVDISSAMIEIAGRSCPTGSFECIDLSLAQLPTSYFDVIICGLVLAHIERLEAPLHNLLNALNHGGIIIITDFHPFLTLMQSKRTFSDNLSGKQYEIKHHLHLFEQYFKAFKKFGIQVEEFEEPVYQNSPVVFGIRGRKISG